MSRDHSVLCASLAAVLAALSSCAHPVLDPDLSQRVRDAEVDPCRVVFICHGMLKDLGADWDEELAADLAELGILAIPVTYWSDPTGAWFNWGWRAPAFEIARLADAIAAEHERLQPGRPLVIDAVAFSNGCEALLEAVELTDRARFRRLILMHSSSLAFSFEADRIAKRGAFESLIHYWSPIDGITLLAPLGAGGLSLFNTSDRIDNRLHWFPHIANLIGEGTLATVCEDLTAETPEPRPTPDEYAEAIATLLDAERADEGSEP